MTEPIQFIASLKRPGKCLKIDAERECEVCFSVPSSDIAEVIKLIGLSDKGLNISVEADE